MRVVRRLDDRQGGHGVVLDGDCLRGLRGRVEDDRDHAVRKAHLIPRRGLDFLEAVGATLKEVDGQRAICKCGAGADERAVLLIEVEHRTFDFGIRVVCRDLGDGDRSEHAAACRAARTHAHLDVAGGVIGQFAAHVSVEGHLVGENRLVDRGRDLGVVRHHVLDVDRLAEGDLECLRSGRQITVVDGLGVVGERGGRLRVVNLQRVREQIVPVAQNVREHEVADIGQALIDMHRPVHDVVFLRARLREEFVAVGIVHGSREVDVRHGRGVFVLRLRQSDEIRLIRNLIRARDVPEIQAE